MAKFAQRVAPGSAKLEQTWELYGRLLPLRQLLDGHTVCPCDLRHGRHVGSSLALLDAELPRIPLPKLSEKSRRDPKRGPTRHPNRPVRPVWAPIHGPNIRPERHPNHFSDSFSTHFGEQGQNSANMGFPASW